MKRTMQSVVFAISYTLFALLICIAVGASFKGCQGEPVLADSPAAETVEIVQYDPCYPMLKYERAEESEQRRKECGVE